MIKIKSLTNLVLAAALPFFLTYYNPNNYQIKTSHASERAELPMLTIRRSLDDLTDEQLDGRIKEHSKGTSEGRFYRVYRYHDLIEDVENEYGIPDGLVAGTSMYESGGSPLAVSDTGDVNLPQINPNAGKRLCGLKIYGYVKPLKNRDRSVRKDALKKHSKVIRSLVERKRRELFPNKTLYQIELNNRDLETFLAALSVEDQRFDPESSIRCSARELVYQHNRYRNWDRATLAYNRGSVPRGVFAPSQKYVKGIKRSQRQYLDFRQRLRQGNNI